VDRDGGVPRHDVMEEYGPFSVSLWVEGIQPFGWFNGIT